MPLSDASTIVAAGIYAATMLDAVDADLTSGNLRAGTTIFGISGDPNVVDTSSGDAVAYQIFEGQRAWVDGVEVVGTLPRPQRFRDNGDGTVTDLRTGLIWLRNANCSALGVTPPNCWSCSSCCSRSWLCGGSLSSRGASRPAATFERFIQG